jgi:hypothetical protein
MIETIEADEAWWPPTLMPSCLGADVVGVVDHPVRQPQQPLLDDFQGYLLRVVTRSPREFEQFLVGYLTRVPGVASIESSIPLRRVKSDVARTP